MNGINIISTGCALPEKIVHNNDIAADAGTTDEWIFNRTGIRQRHYCDDEDSAGLACKAAAMALENSGLKPEQIGLCIVATITPTYATPSVACLVQKELGLSENIPSFDLNAACSGFLYALESARCYMYMNNVDYALITGSEKFSDVLDMSDYGTAILFGDGAGAAIIKKSDSLYYHTIGSRGDKVIWMLGPGKDPSIMNMQGKAVFRFATSIIEKMVRDICKQAGIKIEDIDKFVFHQANERILDFVIRRMKLNPDSVYKNMDKYGNTSAASIPIALHEMNEKNLFKSGDKVLMAGFGGGLTWAAVLIEWS